MYKNHTEDFYNYAHRRITKSLKRIPLNVKVNFIKDVQKWITANGTTYVISRLKDIKQVIFHSVSGFRSTGKIPKIIQESSVSYIKTRQGGRLMAGYLGFLQKLSLYSDCCFEEVIQLLHLYNLFVDEEVTQNDIDELRDIIEPALADEHKQYVLNFCQKVSAKKLIDSVSDALKFSSVSREYILNEEGKCVSTEKVEQVDKSYLLRQPIPLPKPYSLAPKYQLHENEFFFSEVVMFKKSRLYYECVKTFPEVFECLPKYNNPSEFIYDHYHVGKMMLINEGGKKKRWVENTKYIIQHLVDPYAQRLYDIVKYCPWDVTYHEDRAFSIIQYALQHNITCHSVDLSKATDKLPLEYYHWILRKLLMRSKNAKQYIELFNNIAKANVMLPVAIDNIDNNSILTRWGTGQPMGARPSFAMLTLVHGLILLILNDYKWDNAFIVHGDDVVIMDDSLCIKYKQFLLDSGMSYSEYKTISGTAFAEMNSKIITPKRVLYPVRWKEISSENVLEVAPFWGIDLCKDIASNNKITPNEVEAILALPYPLGSNLNPKGLTLDERLKPFDGLIEYLVDREDSVNYIGSYRDLVLERYSKYAQISNKETGNREIDILWYQAMLHDLELADQYDSMVADKFTKCNSISSYLAPLFRDATLVNRTYLSGNFTTSRIDKPQNLLKKSKSKERKLVTKSRMNIATKYYQKSEEDLKILQLRQKCCSRRKMTQ